MSPPTDSTYAEPATLPKLKGLWVEVRDSQSGDRRVSVYAAPVPSSRSERERLLNRSVREIFPGAKLRTYSGGVAKFVSGPLLISAHYGAVRAEVELIPLERKRPEPVAEGIGQGILFAL